MAIGRQSKSLAERIQAPPKDEQLEAKYKLMLMLTYDERARRKHFLVFGFILDWWHKKWGDALASVRKAVELMELRRQELRLSHGKALSVTNTHEALTDLMSWGFLIRTEKGARGNGSRWVPNWALVWQQEWGSVPSCLNATVVPLCPNEVVPLPPNVNGSCVPSRPDKDPSYMTRATTRGHVKKEFASAAQPGTAPPADAAGGPVGGEEGFDVLWRTYKFPQKKLEARVAYSKLNPDPSLQTRLVESAIAWREAWERQGKPDAPRKHLAAWLMDESWDCDAPGKPFVKTARKASKAASKPKPIPAPANSNVRARDWERVEVVASEVVERPKGNALVATLRSEAGDTIVEEITLEHANQTEQDRGQKQFEKLRWAMDLGEINDNTDLHGIAFERRVYNSKSEYRAIKAKAA